jgi:hypothetical protein
MSTQAIDPGDNGKFEPEYGHGGIPWYLVLGYVAFLVFFTWYVLEYQLPDFLKQGPGQGSSAEQTK